MYRNASAHHPAEPLTDRETEAGSPVFAGGGRVDLGEFLEQFFHLCRRHTNAGIRHRDFNPFPVIDLPAPCTDRQRAALGELVGIADEVQQRLPNAHLVSVNRLRRRVAIHHDSVAVVCRQRLERLHDIVDQWGDREGLKVQLHPPSFNLGEIENIVDQGEQVSGGAAHAIERL